MNTSPTIPDVVRRTLAEHAAAPVDPAAVGLEEPIGSSVLSLSSMEFVRAVIAIEDRLGVSFADQLFLDVGNPTVRDVVRHAVAAAGRADADPEAAAHVEPQAGEGTGEAS